MNARAYLLPAILCIAAPASLPAQLAVSANDGKQFAPGERTGTRTADSVSVIDLGAATPRVIGTVAVPASMIGPPTSVAVAPNEGFALVTAAQDLEGENIVKGDSLSVIDLARPSAPRVVQTLRAGSGASGVAINKAGTLALVASTGDDTIAVFAIRGKRLTRTGTVRLDYQSRPTDVTFSPDGRTALAVTQTAGRVVRLAVDNGVVTRAGVDIQPGLQPYGAAVGRDGRIALVTNLGGRLPASGRPAGGGASTIGSVAVLDLASNTLASDVDVGVTPEHVELSPDGRHAAVVVLNGSNALPGSAGYKPGGLLQVYRIDGTRLVKVAESPTGAWCQGATWNRSGTTIVLQCAMAREIDVYRFTGTALTQDAGATIRMESRPGAIATALSR